MINRTVALPVNTLSSSQDLINSFPHSSRVDAGLTYLSKDVPYIRGACVGRGYETWDKISNLETWINIFVNLIILEAMI